MEKLNSLFIVLLVVVGLVFSASCNSCQSQKNAGKETTAIAYAKVSPDFNSDSAYRFVEKQVSFGPRVPGTTAHKACGDYLSEKLAAFGADIFEQKAHVTHYNGQNIQIRNIIGSFQPEKEKRILLFAHWDSRPFADEEPDPDTQNRPIPGADDGASGVGVLLEIARQLQLQPPGIGVDIIFFDLEDWGSPHSIKIIFRVNGGVWDPGIGRKIHTKTITRLRTEFYSIWWVQQTLHSCAKAIQCSMRRMSCQRYGASLPTWDTGNFSYNGTAVISPTITCR